MTHIPCKINSDMYLSLCKKILDEEKTYKYSGKGRVKLLIMKEVRLISKSFGDFKCNNRMK